LIDTPIEVDYFYAGVIVGFCLTVLWGWYYISKRMR